MTDKECLELYAKLSHIIGVYGVVFYTEDCEGNVTGVYHTKDVDISYDKDGNIEDVIINEALQ